MKNIALLILFSIVVISCQQPVDEHLFHTNIQTINLDSLPKKKISINKHQYIPLEGEEEILLTGITELIHRDSVLYIFDRTGKSVYNYNLKDGEIKQIHRIGAGPGEYVNVWDMDVDKDGNVWLYDISLMKLIKYSDLNKELSFKEFNIRTQCMFIGVEDSLHIYIGNVYEKGRLSTWLRSLDLKNNKHENLFLNKEELDLPYNASTYFFRSKENLYFYKKHGEYIYRLNSGKAIPYFYLVSKRHPSKEDLNICQQEKSSFSLYKKNKINEITGFYETDEQIYLAVNTVPTMHIIMNKGNGTILQIEFDMNSELNGHLRIIGATEKYFIGYYQPIEKTLKLLKSKQESVLGKDKIDNLTEESNPILLLFSFQENI